MKKWLTSRDDKETEYGSIEKFGNITLKGLKNGTVHVITEKYSGGQKRHFIMDEFTFRYSVDFEDDVQEDILEDNDSSTELHANKAYIDLGGTRTWNTKMN